MEDLPLQLEAIQIELSRFNDDPLRAYQAIRAILHQLKGGAGFFGHSELFSEIKKFELLNKDTAPADLVQQNAALTPIITIIKGLIQTKI